MRLISIQRIVQFNLNSATIFNKLIFVTVEQKEISVPSLVKWNVYTQWVTYLLLFRSTILAQF